MADGAGHFGEHAGRHGAGAPEVAGGGHIVRLVGAPVATMVATQSYLDDLFRELRLVEVGGTQGIEVPPRLRELGNQLRAVTESGRGPLARQVMGAGAVGHDTVDIEMEVGSNAVARIARMLVLLDEVEQYSQAGALLTPPRSPEVERTLRWVAREVIGQLEVGRRPRAFGRRPGQRPVPGSGQEAG